MTDQGRIERRAARVIVVDAADRVLLLQAVDPARPDEPYWMTPGGGLNAGEDAAMAAARELYEETGLRFAPDRLGEPVRREVIDFPFDGSWYRQEQEYFAARVESWTPAPTGLTPLEISSFRGTRWWSVEELAATDERYYPRDLPAVLRSMAGRAPC